MFPCSREYKAIFCQLSIIYEQAVLCDYKFVWVHKVLVFSCVSSKACKPPRASLSSDSGRNLWPRKPVPTTQMHNEISYISDKAHCASTISFKKRKKDMEYFLLKKISFSYWNYKSSELITLKISNTASYLSSRTTISLNFV